MSTGINPWPWKISDIPQEVFHQLPTKAAFEECRKSMAQAFNTSPDYVLPIAGSEICIRLLPTILSPKKVVILSPGYGDHIRSWETYAQTSQCEIVETDDPLAHADTADIIVICNPNNPDGKTFDPQYLEYVRHKLAAKSGYLIIDEAYADIITTNSMSHLAGHDGLIILRSTGKFYGLAGIRLGALLAPPHILTRMAERLGVWNVSGSALDIGAKVYSDKIWQNKTRTQLKSARIRLDNILKHSGLTVLGGTDLFRYVGCGDAHALWEHLIQNGIYLRKFNSITNCFRIGLPENTAAEMRLASALKGQW